MPPAYRSFITPDAFADLEGVFSYISAGSPQNARSVVKRLLNAIDTLHQMLWRH